MKNLMQLKDLIKNLAEEKNINSQVLLRNYMMQRLLLKIANSDYKNNFILKGGMLVADLVGIESRSTVDMDLTIKSFSLTKEKININLLADALTETAKNRGTYKAIKNGKNIIIDIFKSDIILSHWNRYRNKFQYAKGIEFSNLEEQIINLWNAIEDNYR